MTEQPTAAEVGRLRQGLFEQGQRLDRLQATVRRGAVGLTALVLLLGLLLPFLVPRRDHDLDSATLWQAVSADAPRIVGSDGGFWWIPIVATLIVMATVLSFWNGSAGGRWRFVARVVTVAYLAGCLLGFATLAADDEAPRASALSPGLLTLTLGAALAVMLVFSAAVDLRDERR